jgi:hypothetical protein
MLEHDRPVLELAKEVISGAKRPEVLWSKVERMFAEKGMGSHLDAALLLSFSRSSSCGESGSKNPDVRAGVRIKGGAHWQWLGMVQPLKGVSSLDFCQFHSIRPLRS